MGEISKSLAAAMGTMVTDVTGAIADIAPTVLPLMAIGIGIPVLLKVVKKLTK